MKKILLILFLSFGLKGFTQSVLTGTEQFSTEGRYVKITLLFGSPVKIFVSEKERARIDLRKLKMEVRLDKSSPWQELKLNEYGNYYSVNMPDNENSSPSLEVKTTLNNNKSEFFKFIKP